MPDQRIISDNFANIDLEVEPYSKDLFLTEKVQHSLSKLFAFYSAGEKYVPVQVNSAGELLVTNEGGQVSSGSVAQVAVGTVATVLLAANANRVEVIIQNDGDNDIFIGFTNGLTTANGFKLPAGMSFSTNIYTGVIYGIRDAVTTATASVMEF